MHNNYAKIYANLNESIKQFAPNSNSIEFAANSAEKSVFHQIILTSNIELFFT